MTLSGAPHAADRPGQASRSDALLAAGVLGVIFIILIPLPPAVMDALLIGSLAGSVIILVAAACAATPLDMAAFPSILIIATFFRLALNIATTRLILGNAAAEGALAAGKVVETFAGFVTGGSLIVGFLLFAIIAAVQFVVITKGAGRISEVAARFTLDALPGKQLGIDAELSSGSIGEPEARRRRSALGREADFYGAMDGASKFLRGEAAAGVLILLINLAGGFLIGVLRHGMDVSRAADVFTRLTVGDGLVNQMPALMVSVAGALLVTRGSGGERLGRDLSAQLFSNDRAFFAASVFLIALVPTGIPAPLLLLAAAACAIAGVSARQGLAGEAAGAVPGSRDAGPAPASAPEGRGEKARDLLVIDPIELELGYLLVGLVDAETGGDLMDRLARVRERIALELGLVLPPLSVRDNTRLHPAEYSIKLRGNSVGRWRLRPGRSFLVTDGEPAEGVDGLPGVDPSTDRPGLWIADDQASSASVSGRALRRSAEIIASHLDTVLRTRAAEVLTREEVSRLLADLRKRSPALVDELVPGALKLGELHKVLQNLLREQVSIRDLETILETLADHAHRSRDPGRLTEEVRRSLSRTICASSADRDGVLHGLLLDPALEEFLQRSTDESEGSKLALEPELVDTLTATAVEACKRAGESGRKVILACAGSVRGPFRALLARKLPLVPVLAYEEIADDYRLEAAGTIAVESRAAEEVRFA